VDNAAVDALSRIERQGVLFNLLAGTSNELMDEVVATWSSDKGLQATIKGLKNNTLTSSKNKSDLSAYLGFLHPLPIPDRIWQDISMDFIESLPMSQGKNALLVVVDRLSKYAHFLPITHPYTTLQVAQLFLDNVYKLYASLNYIKSNKNAIGLTKSN
ncbi:retrotransposable element Tf2, partial [Tanacetum coccineum]